MRGAFSCLIRSENTNENGTLHTPEVITHGVPSSEIDTATVCNAFAWHGHSYPPTSHHGGALQPSDFDWLLSYGALVILVVTPMYSSTEASRRW